MSDWKQKIKTLFFLKLKFAMTSVVATAIDYGLYLLLVYTLFEPVISNIISFSIAVIFNFILQKKFVFSLQRKLNTAFKIAMAVSAGGLMISTTLIYFLVKIEFFEVYQYITKLCATGVVFFYNFYLKRYAFEKRFI